MARIVSTTSTYGAPAKAATLKALQERQEALERQQAQRMANQQPIADPWQGVAQLAGTFVNARQQAHAAEQEAAGRDQLAQVMGRYAQTGELSPEDMATYTQLDPDAALRVSADMVRQRREKAQLEETRAYNAGLVKDERAYNEGVTAKASAAATAAEAARDEREARQEAERDARELTQAEAKEKRDREAALKLEQEKARLAGEAGPKLTDIGGARQDVLSDPSYKSLASAAPIWNSITDAATRNTAQADLNIIIGMAKLFDPTSVVREGETETVKKTASLPDNIWSQWQYLTSNPNSRLSDDVKFGLLDEGASRMRGYQDAYKATSDFYTGFAKRHNILPEDIVPPVEVRPWERPKPAAAAAAAAPAEDGGVLGNLFSSGGAVGTGMAAPAAAAAQPATPLLTEGKTPEGLDVLQTLNDARAAIPRKGRAAVEQLLREKGIDPSGL